LAEEGRHEAVARRATDAQVLEDAERLIAAWNEARQANADVVFAESQKQKQRRKLGGSWSTVS
jgi:hypothetical protein